MSTPEVPATPPPGEAPEPPSAPATPDRRELLGKASSLAMGAGLLAAYGTFGAYALRFLYPARPPATTWRFVGQVAEWAVGEAKEWRSPDGRTLTILRQASAGAVDDFIALSDICPHLGCRVHWEAQNKRFFCPCHNGAFDASGKGVSGPPGEAGQSLPRFPLDLQDGRLFIGVADSAAARPPDDDDSTRDGGPARESAPC